MMKHVWEMTCDFCKTRLMLARTPLPDQPDWHDLVWCPFCHKIQGLYYGRRWTEEDQQEVFWEAKRLEKEEAEAKNP